MASSVQEEVFNKTALFTTTALLRHPTLSDVLLDITGLLLIWPQWLPVLFVLSITTAETESNTNVLSELTRKNQAPLNALSVREGISAAQLVLKHCNSVRKDSFLFLETQLDVRTVPKDMHARRKELAM